MSVGNPGLRPMPEGFRLESDAQRTETSTALRAEAVCCDNGKAEDWPLTFSIEDNGEFKPDAQRFRRAAHAVAALGKIRTYALANINRISLRPHGNGRWRLLVGFDTQGPCSAVECDVHQEDLWRAWEMAESGERSVTDFERYNSERHGR
jgi:hypothetical protein